VLILWTLLILQVFTGTVSTDDVLFTGPFHYVFDTSFSDQLAELHEVIFNLLVGFIVLHVVTVLYHEKSRRQRLLLPMLKGQAEGRHGTGPAQPLYKALILAAVLAAGLWYLIGIAPAPPATYW
jgi:cytochrome b